MAPTAIILGIMAAAVALWTLSPGKGKALPEHAHLVTSVPVGVGFEVDHLRVTVESAQWLRQPRAVESIATTGAGVGSAGDPDRVYLEVTPENLAASLRSVGRGEFRMIAPDGASWAPLADDFPEILLGPTEKLTTRLIFEVPPQSALLQLVSSEGARQARIPISDDSVGGLFGALCRTLSRLEG